MTVRDSRFTDIKNNLGNGSGVDSLGFVTKSYEDRDYYIATDGIDTGQGTQARPYKTLQYGFDQTPNQINTNINFLIGSGEFSGVSNLFKIAGTNQAYNYIRIVGTRKILLADTRATSVGSNYIEVAGANFTVDEFKGKMLCPTSGLGFSTLGYYFTYPVTILSNTVNRLYFVRTNTNVAYNTTTHFVIYEPETILSTTLTHVLRIAGTLRTTPVIVFDCEIGGGTNFYSVYNYNSTVTYAGCKFERKNTESGFMLSQVAEINLYGCNLDGHPDMTQGGLYMSNLSIFNSQNNYYHNFYNAVGNRQAIYCNNGNGVCFSDNFEDNYIAVRALRDSSIDLDNECRLVGHVFALYAQRGGQIDGFDCVGSDNDYTARVADGGIVLIDDVNCVPNIAHEYIDSAGGLCVHVSDNYGVKKVYDMLYEYNTVAVPVRTLVGYESGRTFRNGSAAAEVKLPTCEKGLTFSFMIGSANYFKINANTGDNIVINGVAGATAGYIRSNQRGTFIRLLAVDATSWEMVQINNTWLVDE